MTREHQTDEPVSASDQPSHLSDDASRESDEPYRTLFESMSQGVVYQSPNGEIVSANPAAQRILGLSLDQMQGRTSLDPCWRSIREDGSDFPGEEHPSMVALQTGCEVRDVVMGIFNAQTDSYRWIEVDAVPQFRSGEGAPYRAFTTFDDVTDVRNAEHELRDSRIFLDRLVEQSPHAMWISDEHGTMVRMNQACRALLNITDAEVVGKYNVRADNIVEEQGHMAAVRRVFEAGETARFTLHYPSARLAGVDLDHAVDLFLEVTISPVVDDGGRVIHAIIQHIDITDRMLAEEALRESEVRLRAVLDATPFPVALVDTQGDNIDYWSRSALDLFGHTAPTAAEWYRLAYPDPDYRRAVIDRWTPALEEARSSGRAVNTGEYRVTCSDGSVRICELYAAFLADRLIVTFNDITERKQVEEALRQDEERWQFILQASQSGAWDLSLVDHTAFRTLQHDRIFGYDTLLPEWTFEMFLEHVIPEDRADVDRQFQKAVREGGDWDFECRILRRDGKQRWISASGQHRGDAQGQVLSMAGMVQDITARKRAEEEIRRLNADLERRVAARTAELEAANRELESFSYSVSHDLRAPLRALDGFSQVLLQDHGDKLDSEAHGYLERIGKAAQKMSALIDGLLELSRLNRSELTHGRVNLSELAGIIADELREAEPERQVEVVIAEDVIVYGDRNLVRVLLANLIGNAWKFTATHETARIEVGALETDGERAFFVRDDGVGFDMAYADKLFGPFQRLHSPAEFEGTGIGLATAQRIVQRHGGRVWAESEVEKGATFYFTWPGVDDHPEVERPGNAEQ